MTDLIIARPVDAPVNVAFCDALAPALKTGAPVRLVDRDGLWQITGRYGTFPGVMFVLERIDCDVFQFSVSVPRTPQPGDRQT